MPLSSSVCTSCAQDIIWDAVNSTWRHKVDQSIHCTRKGYETYVAKPVTKVVSDKRR